MELIGFALDSQPVAQGATRINSALDSVGKHIDAMVDKAAKINSKFTEAFRFGGGSGGGAGRGLDDLAAKTRKLADETLRYAQAQARLQQSQGNTAGAIRTLTEATKNHEGSVRTLIGAQTQLSRLQASQSFSRYASTVREAGESLQQTGYFLTGITAGLLTVGAAAVKSAFDIDKNVNTLKALLGSADAAESRFQALRKLSQVTPGLTTGLASQLDVQLRVANATESAINKVLPAIGKLNAVSNLQDPQKFVQNLVQLVTQNFERIDLKELIGQSPLAGELIKQIFKVDSAIDSKAIQESAKKLGLTTVDAFFSAFGEAAATNSKLANVTESLETQFAKIVDRVTNALRPLGTAIIEALGPIVEVGARIVEGFSKIFSGLPKVIQQAIVIFGGLATAIGPATVAIGAFVQAAGAIGNLAPLFAKGGSLASIGAFLAPLLPAAPVILAIAAALGIAAIAWSNYESAADRGAKVTASGVKSQLAEVEALKEVKLQASALLVGRGQLNDVLRQLEPSTRAYIESISDEQTKTRELNRVLAEQIALKQSKLAADVGDTGAAAARAQEELAFQERRLAALKKFSEEAAKIQQAGGSNVQLKLQQEAVNQLGSTLGSQFGQAANSAKFLGQAITDTTGKIGGLKNAEVQFGAVINQLFEANKQLTIEGFVAQQRAIGTSESAIQAAVRAYEAFKQQQIASANSASSTTSVIDQQAAAVDKLRSSLEALNATANTEVDRRIKDIALTSRNAAEAKAKLRQNVKLDDDFAFALQEKNRVAANLAALNEATDPTPKRRSGGSRTKELTELQQLQKQLKEAEKDLSSFQKTNSKEFGLRLQLEDARRFKSELEEIISLRRDLGEPLKAALPATGTAARAEIERLKALKELREFEKTVDVRTPFIQAQEASIEATKKQIEGLDKFINESLPRTEEATIEAALAQNELYKALLATNPALAEQYLLQAKNADETIRAAKATETFKAVQDELNGRLTGMQNLSNAQSTALRLQGDAYKTLTTAQKEQLVLLAEQVDQQELYQAQLEESRRIAEQFGQVVTGLFETLFERGPKAFFEDLLSTLKRTLSRMAAEILSSQVMKLLGFGGGQSSSFGFGGGSARSTSPLAGLGGILTGGGGSASGGGGFLTGGFAGGPGAGGILSGGSSGGGGLLGGILGKIPGLGKLFGAGGGAASGAGAVQNIGGLPFIPNIAPSLPLTGPGGAGAASGLGASLGGLAAGGAIAGGGLLGSLAGGKSPIGRLLGGVGGSLLGGFGAALLNPALLPVLFSNPITAIIGGALIGGALLFNFLGGREQRKFRKTVEDEYQIKVDGKQQGTELYKSIKALGEEQFGKGKFGKKMLETIRLQKAQEQLAAYAEASGQENNALVKKFRDQKELTNQFDPRNQFVKRYAGGPVNAFQSYVVGEHRAEVFTPSTSGQIYPSFPDFAKAGAQLSGGDVGGGWTHEFRVGMQRLTSAIARFEQASARIEGMPPETVLVMGAKRNPDVITSAVATSFDRRTAASDTVRDRVNQR